MTSAVSERDYVAATIKGSFVDEIDRAIDEEEQKVKRQREKNIKQLRKQVLALAHEELAKATGESQRAETGTAASQALLQRQKSKIDLITPEN